MNRVSLLIVDNKGDSRNLIGYSKDRDKMIKEMNPINKEKDISLYEATFNILQEKNIYKIVDLLENDIVYIIKIALSEEDVEKMVSFSKKPFFYGENELLEIIRLLGGEVLNIDGDGTVYW